MPDIATGPAIVLSVLAVGSLLTIILVPMSFSRIEYWEYGLQKRKTSGVVDYSRVYGAGRHLNGPLNTFIKYQADAHFVSLEELSVFSAGQTESSIGLEFVLDVDFTFLLKKDEIPEVHQELARQYETVIVSRTRDAIKNEAIFVTFTEYFQKRLDVEKRFRKAVETRWEEAPSLHATLDTFNLGRIRIPETVAAKQLEARVQNERNSRESFLQQAEIQRELTQVEVNSIQLEREKILRTAEARASLIKAMAVSQASQIQADAANNGTQHLYETAGFTEQNHKISFSYIRTLMNRAEGLDVNLNYLTPENVLKTTSV